MKTVIMSRATIAGGARVLPGDEVELSDGEAKYFLSRGQCQIADPKAAVDAEIKGEIHTRKKKLGKNKAAKRKSSNGAD